MTTESQPLYALTIGEFMALTKQLVMDTLKEREQTKKDSQPEDAATDEHFNISELAAFLKCSKVSVHGYKKKGLPFYRIGRKILFKKTEVLNFMRNLRNRKRIQ